jgi:hypothetical protein
MAAEYDSAEFVDGDLQTHRSPQAGVSAGAVARAPTREEVDARVVEAQQKLVELKRVQEELERERAALEETRRRQREFQTGRQEVAQNLTRGLGLLEEAEFNARREAEQMAKAILDLREALNKVQAINEEAWTRDNFSVELTRALTSLENARMEWNSARLKFPVLAGQGEASAAPASTPTPTATALLSGQTFGELFRLGWALTWPLALVGLLALGALVALLVRR